MHSFAFIYTILYWAFSFRIPQFILSSRRLLLRENRASVLHGKEHFKLLIVFSFKYDDGGGEARQAFCTALELESI